MIYFGIRAGRKPGCFINKSTIVSWWNQGEFPDRIGRGPWQNAKGVVVAQNVDDLHSNNNKLGKENSLTEKGGTVGPHDMLTGSGTDGRALSGDKTCSNWTSSADGTGTARLGHYDKQGGGENPNSWNSAHDSRGCSQTNLVSTGGAGAFYCFAQ